MSWLKDRWEELNAQVKMGDNKTASTVRAARKPAAPAQTMRANTNQPGWSVRKPQPAPLTTQQRISQSYGPTGFTGLKNYAKDMLFDNNSEADRIKRYAATGLNESYDQEQARKTKEAQASNDKLGTIHQVMKSLPAGAGFLAKTPGAIGQMQGRTAKMVNEIDNPLLRTGAKLVSAPLGGLMTTKQADTNIKTGRGLNERIDNKIQQSAFGDRADDNKYVTGAGKMFGQLGGQIATGGLGTVAIGSQMAADEANKAEAAGKSNTYSTLTGFGQGGIGALSEKYGVDKFIPGKGNVAGNFVTRMGKRIFTEGAQEAQQQFTQNYIANKAYNPNQSLKEGVLESALMGGLAGGAMSPAVDIMNRPTAPKPTTSLVAPKPEPTRTRLRPEEARIWSDYQETLYKGNRMPAQVVNETHNKARQIADSLGVDIITGSPDEIAGRMNPLLEQSMAFQKEPTTSLVRPRALNQSGYIQLPGGQDTQLNDTELGVLNYLNNKPVQEGSATQGEGNALPTELSAGKRQSYLDKMKKMVTPLNEGGYIAGPLALDFNKAKAKGLVFDGVDGKPRFEVSDRNAKLVNDGQTADALMNGETVQLDEVLDHPDLYKQYPELQFTNFKLDKTIEGDAEFAGNTIRVNPDNMTDDQSIVETILHEVQHNVQDIEGFASGGNKGRGGNKRYQNLAGEAEARAVASRMDMPMSERYVKPEGETFYHGTTEKWQGDEPKFPLYTTPSKKYAQVFADSTAASSIGKSGIKKADGSMVREFKLNPKARILDATNPKVRAMLDKEYFGRYSVSDKFYPGKNGHLDWTEGENLAEFIAEKKLPYDAVKLDEGGGGLDPQFGVMVDDKGTSVLALNKDAISPNKPRSTFYDSLDVPKQDLIIRNGDGKAMSLGGKKSLKDRLGIKPLNEGGYIQLGAPEPKKLSQDIKDQFSKQGSFGRDAMDRLEANKISKGDLERAGVIFDPKQVKKIAQTLPEFKDNPVMTYRKGDYRYMSDNGRYRSTPDVAESGTFEFKHKDGVMRLNPEALLGKEMAQKLAQTAKDGEQVDFTDTMKASGNRLFTYDQTADKPTPTVAKPVQKQVTEKQNSVDPLESLKQEATPKYMQDKVTPEGYFTEGRYKDSAYPKNFVAKADIPHTGIKAGDRVALIKGRDGRFDAILSKKYKEKSTGYTISRESFVDPKSFTSSTKGTSPELVPTPVKQTAKGNNTPIKGTQSQPPKSPLKTDLLDVATAKKNIQEVAKNGRWEGWYGNGDTGYLPMIEKDILANKSVRDAGASLFYDNYKKANNTDIEFDEFMNKDITLYRGGKARTDNIVSYSFDKNMAARHGEVSSITVKPKDTYGMFTTTAEQEVLVPIKSVSAPRVGKTDFEQSLEKAGIKPRGLTDDTAYEDMKRGVTSQLQQQATRTQQTPSAPQQSLPQTGDRLSTSQGVSNNRTSYIYPAEQQATQSQPPKSAAKIVEATDTRKADRWATPLPDTGKTPIPKKLDTNGVQIKEGDKIEFYGASPGGKKGTATIRWEGPHRANASGKEFPGKWLGNGTLDNNIPFTVVERNGKPFAPTKPPTPFEQNLQTAGLMPKKSKGVVLAEGKTAGGQRVRKTLRGPGQSSVDTVAQDVQRGIKAESSAIADALGIPLEDRTPSAQNQRPLEKIVRTAETETMQDVFDQKDYGVKEISNTPNHTYSDLFEKHLGIKGMSEVDLNKSNRTGVKKVRDAVGKANPLRAVDKGVGTMFEKLSRSNKLGRAISRTAQYINKTAGQDPMVLEASKRLAGDGTHTDAMLVELGQKAYSLVPSTDSRARVHAVLDPEGTNAGLKYKDLTTQEQQAADTLRDIGETINDASFRAGMITRKKWESNRGGRYIARMYNELENAPDVADYLDIPDSRGLFLGMYKTRVEMNDVLRQKLVRDPVKLAVIRARQVRSNEALMEYMRTADVAGYVKQAPTKGYIKVKASEGERMHNWRGKYVRQDVYENVNGFTSLHKSANAMNDLLDLYDGNPARKLRKKMLTIYNPVVRTGNIASNYFFAYLNGVNPVTYQKNKMWAKKAIKGNDPLVLEARKAGLIGNNIVASDKNLFDKDKEFMRDVSKMDSQKLGDRVKSVDDKMSNRYGMADDLAKLSALKAHVDRGYSVRQAITKTGRGFQDYSRVGHLYDMAAKSPVFGNAFIRFQGDLYTNIIKNAAVDHPIRLASIPFATLMIGNALSALSGENEEDKKTREDRLGAPKIPFTDISTEFQTPWGAVDVARFTPLYMRNVLTDNDGDGSNKKGIMDDISRLAPVNLPANMSKEEWARSAATDPLLGPLISMVTDVDWRGKSVRDPDGVRDGKQLFPEEKLTTTEKAQNIAQYGVRSYAPYPFNEVGDILASVNQNKRNEQVAPGTKGDPFDPNATMLGRTGYNTSGSKKTVGQSIARLGGVRAQQFGAKEAEGQRERNDMFKFFGEIDKWKDDLSGTVKSAFEARHKSNATRSGIKKEFTEDPWYKYKNAGELLQNPELFEAEKQYALKQNKYDGKPIDPLFDLPPAQRNIVLAKKLKLPGSKDEGFNTLYDQEWYQDFRKKQDTYYASKDQYKAKMGFADIKETNPYPEADQRVQKDMDYYFSLPSGTGERSSFIRNNPKVWEAITGQWDKQNAWTDEERKRLGLPAINREDDKKYSSSGGKRGGRGGKGKASKFDYTKNLFDSGSDSASTSKQLRAILEKAMSGKS